jgi:hypothetical protein
MDSSFGFGRGFAWVETAMPFLTKRFYLETLMLSILTARPKIKAALCFGYPGVLYIHPKARYYSLIRAATAISIGRPCAFLKVL